MERPSWFRGFIQGKTRIVIAWIFCALLVAFADRYPTWPGILVCFIGATIRFHASGFLYKDMYPAIGGLYSITRNPLYLGTYFMAIGTALSIHNWILAGVISVFFGVIYHYIILDEETKLEEIFGESYDLYRKIVPRFFPSPWPASKANRLLVNPDDSQLKFSWSLAFRNRAYEPYLVFLALIGGLRFIAHVRMYHLPF